MTYPSWPSSGNARPYCQTSPRTSGLSVSPAVTEMPEPLRVSELDTKRPWPRLNVLRACENSVTATDTAASWLYGEEMVIVAGCCARGSHAMPAVTHAAATTHSVRVLRWGKTRLGWNLDSSRILSRTSLNLAAASLPGRRPHHRAGAQARPFQLPWGKDR